MRQKHWPKRQALYFMRLFEVRVMNKHGKKITGPEQGAAEVIAYGTAVKFK